MAKKIQRAKPKPKKQKKSRQINKPNARQRKKEHKKELQQRFRGSEKLTYNELLIKEEKADRARKQRENRYQENLKLVAESGVNVTITKSMSKAQVIEAIKKEKRKQKRIETQEKKIAILMDHGLTREEAEQYKNLSFDKIHDFVTTVYTIKKWAAAAWADVTGESDLATVIEEMRGLSVADKIDQIDTFYLEALDDPDGSGQFQGIPVFIHGDSKEYVLQSLAEYKKRNYSFRLPHNYAVIGVSNKFSVEGVADMMYLAMARTLNRERTKFYDEVEFFCKMYLPEIHKRIF